MSDTFLAPVAHRWLIAVCWQARAGCHKVVTKSAASLYWPRHRRPGGSGSYRCRRARLATGQEDVRRAVGLNLGALIARSWLVGLTILAVGLAGEREDGLTAAVLVLAAFTVYFVTSLLLRPLEGKATRP